MSEVKLEELEQELLKQKKRTKRLLKLNKRNEHELLDQHIEGERFEERIRKLEVCYFYK